MGDKIAQGIIGIGATVGGTISFLTHGRSAGNKVARRIIFFFQKNVTISTIDNKNKQETIYDITTYIWNTRWSCARPSRLTWCRWGSRDKPWAQTLDSDAGGIGLCIAAAERCELSGYFIVHE